MRTIQSHIDSDASASGQTPFAAVNYLRAIDATRRFVAVAAGACALALIVSSRQSDYLFHTLKQEPGLWAAGAWISGCCLLVCAAASFLLVVEALVRPPDVVSLSARALLRRLLWLSGLLASVWTCAVIGYGVPQAISAVAAASLMVAAIGTRGRSRVLFGCLAAALIGFAIRQTNHAYHYARWHADEIVAAGRTVADTSTFGVALNPNWETLPMAFRRLGVQRMLVEPNRVVIYHSGVRPAEFQIYTQPPTDIGGVWINRGGKAGKHVKITDKLWMIVDN